MNGPASGSTSQQSISRLSSIVVICVIFSSWIFFAGVCVSYLGQKDGQGLVSLLLCLPPAAQTLVLILLRPRSNHPVGSVRVAYGFTMLLGTTSYLTCWLFFGKSPFSWLIPVGASALLVGLAFLVSCVTLSPESLSDLPSWRWLEQPRSYLSNVGREAASHPMSTISFFLGVFLCVTYLLAFAFAFHDRADPANPGLLVVYRVTQEPDARTDSPSPRAAAIPATADSRQPALATFHFKTGEAVILSDPKGIFPSDPNSAYVLVKGMPDPMRRTTLNNMAIRQVVDSVSGLDRYERIRITMMGHADPNVVQHSRTYQTNLELSVVRAQQTQRLLSSILEIDGPGEWQRDPNRPCQVLENIEWVLMPVSNEGDSLKTPGSPPAEGLTSEVSVLPIRDHVSSKQIKAILGGDSKKLLMDYVYFTIYTITTTGYGDIIPRTTEAKFIVSVANLYEVFFLVIFFNAVVSGRRKQDADDPPATVPHESVGKVSESGA